MAKHSSYDAVTRYVAAITVRDSSRLEQLRSRDYVLEAVPLGGWTAAPSAGTVAGEFYGALFAAFTDFDFEASRTVAGAGLAVVEWTLTGAGRGTLRPPLVRKEVPVDPGTAAVAVRGVTVFEVAGELVRHETVYFDLATLLAGLRAGL